ncbi:hypothetical protein H310_03074 [Aphanomyces invadans]|uniref:Uncharacterized protein n=1 Tax=Aphanomyces invadans TaxID=157072 RepID=A0A024UKL8_9STRA|nr:hypothetical protein H310_03074 [Aphanomyces invadans]ETW06971.1 hypothetical protein H310_03074 [Aphanomyces invadans]|eukprot:XP_008865046.1 hypothetical protein H310_03074 [Aphanomyces invadans]
MRSSSLELNNMLQYVHLDEKWFYFTKVSPQRDNVNRKAGTLETKSVVVTKDVYRTVLLEKHDNARAHVTPSDPELQSAFNTYRSLGWMMSLAPQPPNSPDTNVLDLGFFAAIQSLQHRKSARTIDELVGHEETLKLFGGNGYKVPHMSKHKEERKGMLPENVLVPSDVFDAATVKLDGMTSAELRRVLTAEVEDARCIDEFAQALEAAALGDEESDDMITVLGEAGIDPISVEDDE